MGSRVFMPPGLVPLHKSVIAAPVASLEIDAAVDWTRFPAYKIFISGLKVSVDDREIYLRLYDTILASYPAGAADYSVASAVNGANFASLYLGNGAGVPQISFMKLIGAGRALGNAAAENFNAEITLFDPASAVSPAMLAFNTSYNSADATSVLLGANGVGMYQGTNNAVGGIQLLPETGNLTGGIVQVCGVGS